MINIALPKGRLGEKVYAMLEEAGYECPSIKDGGRKLIFENEEKYTSCDIISDINTIASLFISCFMGSLIISAGSAAWSFGSDFSSTEYFNLKFLRYS